MTGGSSLSKLGRRDQKYLAQFMAETFRAEATHLPALLWIPLLTLFNPRWVMPIHLLYGLLSNIPCWLVQRVNRVKLRRLES